MLAARLRRVGLTLEHDDLERWCGGWALRWHRADLGSFGAHVLSRCARVARMDSRSPLLATHFLLEKQVEARAHGASGSLIAIALCGWMSSRLIRRKTANDRWGNIKTRAGPYDQEVEARACPLRQLQKNTMGGGGASVS
jgi:hypothetical protein